jgi:hypothetical protein
MIGALGLSVAAVRMDAAQTINWTGNFTSCSHHAELLKHSPMSLGVKFSTSNRSIEKEFKRAMDFWSSIVDMEWHEDNTSACSINVVDGTPDILTNSVIARSQFPEWDDFQGWIAFDPHAPLSRFEVYVTAVHEIGHMLGLRHSANAASVMYFLDIAAPEIVDANDLLSLAEHHQLRIAPGQGAIPVSKHFALVRAKSRHDVDQHVETPPLSTARRIQPVP